MRIGYLIAGAVLVLVAFFVVPSFWSSLSILLGVIGFILIILGAVLPSPKKANQDQTRHVQDLHWRIYWLESRLWAFENRLWHMEKRAPGPPEEPPTEAEVTIEQQPTEAPVSETPPVEAPPVVSPVIPQPIVQPELVQETKPPEPTAEPTRTAPAGMSWLEMELGEKWFQRIGIIVLVVAFVFILALAIPHMTPEQIIGVDFATAIALAILGEYIYVRRKLPVYAKGLMLGAFAIAYIGVWGGGFHFNLPGFPWPYILGALIALGSVAALRYRSPFLSLETGFVFLGWILWLRFIEQMDSLAFAVLISLGSLTVLLYLYALKDELSVLTLTFGFDAVALASFNLLEPYGFLPVLVIGLVTATIVALLRLEKIVSARPMERMIAWIVGIGLTYGLLIAHSFVLDDITIFATFITLTVAIAASEILAEDKDLTLIFGVLMAVMSFPIPLLMRGGEIALLVYPALLIVLAFVRPVKGMAWLTNAVFLGLVAFAAIGDFQDITLQMSIVWGLFFGTIGLHVFLEKRAGYSSDMEALPLNLLVFIYVIVLSGLTARWIPGAPALILYAVALPLAILLNRQWLLNWSNKMALVVASIGISFALARWWAFPSLVGDDTLINALLGVYHLFLMLSIALLVFYRETENRAKIRELKEAVPFSLPAVLLLTGLLAQDFTTSLFFVFIPLAAVLIAYFLDDALTFNLAYILLGLQIILGFSRGVDNLVDNLSAYSFLILGSAIVLLILGFLFTLFTERKVLGKTSQIVATLMCLISAPIAFGTDVGTTISWAIVGAIAVAWGLWRRFPHLRYIGFLLFFMVLGKVFMYDIAGLALEIRIIGLIIVALCLLVISYGYAQYRKSHAREE